MNATDYSDHPPDAANANFKPGNRSHFECDNGSRTCENRVPNQELRIRTASSITFRVSLEMRCGARQNQVFSCGAAAI